MQDAEYLQCRSRAPFLNMIIPFLSPLSANEDYLIVDDTVVSNTEENYFTYSAGTDENGVVGWSSIMAVTS